MVTRRGVTVAMAVSLLFTGSSPGCLDIVSRNQLKLRRKRRKAEWKNNLRFAQCRGRKFSTTQRKRSFK